MMRVDVIIAQFPDLGLVELRGWIELGWVRPEPDGADWAFENIDVARVRLIYDLRRNFALPEDSVPLILSLMDQVYDLRATLKAVSAALDTQPPEVRKAVLAAMAGAAAP
jgi:chaperone modulatory protein CbpM